MKASTKITALLILDIVTMLAGMAALNQLLTASIGLGLICAIPIIVWMILLSERIVLQIQKIDNDHRSKNTPAEQEDKDSKC